MSKLLFPFMFKRNVVSRHNIKHILPSLTQNKFFTGAKTGEIIVWQQKDEDFIPKLLLVPCLNQNVGPLTSMTLIRMPEAELMVYSEFCLVTAHTDSRLRVWDTNDGRCISISPHDIFVNEQEIKEVRPLFDNLRRFVACQGFSQKVYIVDIWKMRCCRVISAAEDEKIINFQIFRNKEIQYMSIANINFPLLTPTQADRLSYVSVDIGELFNPDVYEYGNYILNIQQVNNILQESGGIVKNKRSLNNELSLNENREYNLSLLDYVFFADSQIFFMIYESKICIFDRESVNKHHEEKIKHMNLFLAGVNNLAKATIARHDAMSFLLVSTKRGDLIFINLDEIIQLWQLHTTGPNEDIMQSNNNYRFMKIKDSHHCNVFLNPFFVLNQKYEQVITSKEKDRDLIAMGRNLTAIDPVSCKLISFEIIEQTFNFYDIGQSIDTNRELYSFMQENGYPGYSKAEQERLTNAYDQDTVTKIIQEQNKFFVKPQMTFPLTRLMKENPNFSDIFHPFFLNHFNTDLSNVLKPDERVTVTTMAYHRRVEPLYIFGTNLGRVLIFQLFYSTHDSTYNYYSMKVDEGHEINILYVRKSLLFCSSEKGKLVVFSVAIPDINRAAIQNHREDIGPNLVEIDISSLKQYETMLVSPLKRVLRVKLLHPNEEETRTQDNNYLESVKRYKDQIALILKNNSLVTFSCQTVKIEFECKSNEISVLGVFIQPMLDYLLILNANGSINLYSTNTGRFERTVALKDYGYLMDLPDLLESYANHYQEHHRYSISNESINKYGSRVHGILEYNSRYLKNFLFRMEKESEKNVEGKYQILSERLGNIRELNLQKTSTSQLVWLLHYSTDFIYASKYKRSGVAFLNLFLDNPVACDDKLASMAHVLLIDAKTCFQPKSGDNKKMEESKSGGEFKLVRRKSRSYTLDLANSRITITPFIFPWGIDAVMDEEIITTCGYKIPVFDFYHGIQGIGETFSFLLTDDKASVSQKFEISSSMESSSPLKGQRDKGKVALRLDNWQTSNYYTTFQALGFMLYFILTSHNEDERILTTAIMRTVDLLNSKCVKLIPDFKPISVNLLTHLCPVDDADLIASACNLIVSAILHLERPINSDLIIRFYQYIKTSLSQAEKSSQNIFPVENFETVLLASLSYWVCFYENKDDKIFVSLHSEIAEFCFQTIMKVIDIPYCLHNPYAVSASLKLLVDGISVYKKYITKLEDLFFKVIMINFHYSASLDENIKSSRDLTNITNPIASKFKGILEEINKQTPDIRRLIRQMSLKALLSLGDSYQREFVFFAIKEAKNIALNLHYPSIVIEIIRNYVKKYRNKILTELPRLVEGILYCLDPNNPVLRKSSHKAASHALQTIFRLYGNVSFHQQTQRFALGAMDNSIIIYDLRTAVKLKTLEGHNAPVSCLAFSSSGKYLASFSYKEGSLRIWKVGGASGFLTSVFGVSSKHIKMYEIPKQSYQKGDLNGDHVYILEFSEDEKHVNLSIDDQSGFQFAIQ